ncbi:type II toxin-antitoxin system RelB/DinJ family antitoxin [Tistrella mobilis]|jgi:DNA-damage-inducible protein J|uniref:Addiction module antitoxin n=1 Tax=Tistrella mobilis (strain KA081020-065) TaxID=1110502 RepID=I3TTS4_TISMK|nr:type II toxin-antitoxin system RelB/DinJ family antitoxin [Tistrella mobilis]AFK56162.1 addiction module antitoxin [Tistrella mobilis KA081020-065]MAM72242.1 type II toxin-antitoxin system RelB/DinJ family antitoxin [Tistrella sp.]
MAVTALVQARIDAEVKEKASAVLDGVGLTLSDVVRIVLTRVAREGALPPGLVTDPATHDAWFRARVQEALDDTAGDLSHDEVNARLAARREAALRRAGGA